MDTIMAKSKTITGAYEALPKLVKIILQIFFGAFIGGIYRIIRFCEKGNLITLIAGILVLVTGIGNLIAWIADLYTEATADKITLFAD